MNTWESVRGKLLRREFLGEVARGVAAAGGDEGFGCAGKDEVATARTTFGTEIDDVVGRFYDIKIMFNHNQCVAALNQGFEGREEAVDVVEVESRGGFVEDEERGDGALLREVVGQFHALVLAAREGRGRLPEFDVAESHIAERAKALDDLLLAVRFEEVEGLVDGHFEEVVNVLSLKTHVEDFVFEAVAMAGFTFENEVGHELHFHLHRAFALALFAAAAVGVEGEEFGVHFHLARQGLFGHEFANLVEGLDIGDGVGARGTADGVLVDEIDGLHGIEVAGEVGMLAGTVARLVEMTEKGFVEDIAYEGGFTRTRYARHDGEDVEGEAHIDAAEVVFASADNVDEAIPPTARSGHGNGFGAGEEVERVAAALRFVGMVRRIGRRDLALPHHFAAETAGFGADVDEVVGGADDVFVVFDHNDGVAHIAELAQHANEAIGVARVQPDGGFVEDVKTAHQAAAERGGEVDALAFAARERVAEAVEGEVTESHFVEEAQAAADFDEQALRHGGIVLREGERVEPLGEIGHRQAHEVGDGAVAHTHVEGFGAQTRAVANGALGLAAVAREHDAVLDLVGALFEGLEETIDAHIDVALLPGHAGAAVPEQIALGGREIVVGFEDGEVVGGGTADEFLLPLAEFCSAPAHHGAVVDRERAIGDDEMLVDAHHAPETFATRAGTHGIVERKEVVARFFEADAVGLEVGGETLEVAFGIESEEAFAVTLVERRFDRVVETRHAVFRTVDSQAVEEEEEAAFCQGRFVARHSGGAFDGLVHTHHVAV